MTDLSLDLAGRSAFEPGQTVPVTAKWDLKSPLDAVELRVVWNTASRGDVELQIAKAVRIESPHPSDTLQMTLTLPRQPYSFSGKLVSLVWALELVAIPSLASTRTQITIGPGGKAVRLPELSGQ
jgi:hypothetical protein